MEKLAFTRVCLSDVSVIMAIMRIPLVELLYQTVMDGFLHLSTCYQAHVGLVAMSCRTMQ
jgi:hypothetical protein